MGGGSQGRPAAASPVPAARRGCCSRTRDLQRAAPAESVLWRREGERAEFEGRRGRGEPLAPFWNAAVSGEGRQGQRLPRDTRAGTRGSGSAVRDGTAPALSRHGGKGMGWQARLLSGSGSSLLQLPPRFALSGQSPCGEGAGACRGSRRLLRASPLPGHACLPRVGKPRPRAPRPPLPAAFPLRFYNDFLPEKSNLFARQVRRDQQSVVYYVFIFLSSPPALYRLTVDLTFGISAHTQQLNGNKLSTFTSDKHYP